MMRTMAKLENEYNKKIHESAIFTQNIGMTN